jgi:hypothetical protein
VGGGGGLRESERAAAALLICVETRWEGSWGSHCQLMLFSLCVCVCVLLAFTRERERWRTQSEGEGDAVHGGIHTRTWQVSSDAVFAALIRACVGSYFLLLLL